VSESIEPPLETAPPRETAPGMGVAEVRLKPRKVRPFFGRHPWVLDSAVAGIDREPADGDVVDLISDKGRFVARGLFNSHSRIRVRLYTWSPNRWTTRFGGDGSWRRSLCGAS
jgi:23S rRNA G2069 N7-methylase RlmK/C1962 C5-methylase RlmI